MKSKLAYITLSLVLLMGYAQAQNPFLALLGSGAGSEERLLYKKPAGPYEITVDGERLLQRSYFKLDIRENGQAIDPNTNVTLTLTPPESAGIPESSHTANFDGKHFLVDTIKLNTDQDWGDDNWFITISINNETSTSFGTLFYAPKPAQDIVFSAINIALPLIVLALFIGLYSLRGIKLEQAIA